MKLVAYIRVSDVKQASRKGRRSPGDEDKLSLVVQAEKIRSYAATFNHEIVDVYQDVATASNMDRPGLQAAIAALAHADGLVIYKLDRLTRNVVDIGQLLTGPLANKSLCSVCDHIDTGTAGGRLVVNVLATVAQWERETIADRVREGVRAAIESGRYIGGARMDQQWVDGPEKHSPKVLADRPEVIDVLRSAWSLHQAGSTLKEIADVLNAQQALGRKWHKMAVHRALRVAKLRFEAAS
jgi:DNA invertase Pin-like site-specific DNA recombinase